MEVELELAPQPQLELAVLVAVLVAVLIVSIALLPESNNCAQSSPVQGFEFYVGYLA